MKPAKNQLICRSQGVPQSLLKLGFGFLKYVSVNMIL